VAPSKGREEGINDPRELPLHEGPGKAEEAQPRCVLGAEAVDHLGIQQVFPPNGVLVEADGFQSERSGEEAAAVVLGDIQEEDSPPGLLRQGDAQVHRQDQPVRRGGGARQEMDARQRRIGGGPAPGFQ
jgi:hypothetical protein